ncbi:hypothetical protein K501DRAFT_252849 [Backusella circina FSU 941]|nr:hypothetical protein K501DRAFT_252849 [Backusella circina FSU 941]
MLSKDNLPVFINRPPTAPVTRKSDSNYVISQIKEHTQKKGKKRSETSRQRRLRRKRQKDKGASIDNKSIVFNDNDVKYTTMRTKAHQALILKITMKKKCVEAFKDGNKKLGNELLAVSRTHHSEMIKLNKQAADHKYNEINKGRPSTVIDLHGLFISEAREKVKTAIEKCRRENKPEMILIVGNGNHSHDKVSKLKPAMITYVESLKLRCIPNKPNSGCLLIQLVSL